MSLRTITYVSSAKEIFTQEKLWELLRRARDANAQHDITGMLLYKDGSFIQAIEGPPDAIGRLYDNICADQTHHLMIKLIDDPISERAFADWSMGFQNLSAGQPAEPGFTEYLKIWPAAVTAKRPTPPEALLAWFRDTYR